MVKGKNKLKISVLGDSISTYEGYNPEGYKVYYAGERLLDNQMASVDDAWWKQVIDGLGGELCVNNSFSGSTVTGEFFPAACSDERCCNLHGQSAPDIILIYIGTNDRGFKLPVDTKEPETQKNFYGAYCSMLKKLKSNYPLAKILCATLPMGRIKGDLDIGYDRFMVQDLRYNQAIRLAVQKENCMLADLAAFGERYETLDYCHPTKDGHTTLAELWLKALKSYNMAAQKEL